LIRKLVSFLSIIVVMQGCSYTVPEPKPYQLEGLGRGAIAGNLVIASQPSPEGLKHFTEQGFGRVISARGEGEIDWDEAGQVKALGMEYVEVPMGKPLVAISDEQVELLDQALKSSTKPILLHCGSSNRAAGLWTVWLVERKGVAIPEALRLGRLMGMTSTRVLVDERLGLAIKKN